MDGIMNIMKPLVGASMTPCCLLKLGREEAKLTSVGVFL